MMPMSSIARRTGFTLVELLVSMALLVILLLVLISITDSTRKIWSQTTVKASQFRDAREAFEAITRKLSQATLNTYLDYEYPPIIGGTDAGKPDTTQPPKRYVRQSELRFISGTAATLITGSNASKCPTHAVFFQAPLGFSDDASHSNLEKLLNTCGYFIQFGDDSQLRPGFLDKTNLVPLRNRFRLMEMVEPAESLSLYKYTNGNPAYSGTSWFNDPLALNPPPVQVRAENIVALVILPKLTPEEDPTGRSLAPNYSYDSTSIGASAALTGSAAAAVNSKNQIPPVIQVTMVAVDEISFSRLQSGSKMPDFFGTTSPFSDASKYDADLRALEQTLQNKRLNYRVFTTNVSLKTAKWSREQTN